MVTKYTQDWVAYDKAKTKESILFKAMLSELLHDYFAYETKQGKRICNRERLFMMALKVYYNADFRKCQGLIEEFTGRKVSYKSLCNFFEDETLSAIIDDLILITALPTAILETTGAIDATGFSTSIFENWNENKWGTAPTKKDTTRIWRKLHAVVGCKTNVFISVEVTKKNVSDVKGFENAMKDKTKYFNLEDFVADKAYSSKKVLEFLNKQNLNPIIPFKKNVTGKSRGSYIWMKMFKYFKENQKEFLERYHKRSNVETSFHMLKRKFGNNIRTKTFNSNVNEIKIRCLCHNICVLIQEKYENSIDIDFQVCVNTITAV